jgi:hypothetical protein
VPARKRKTGSVGGKKAQRTPARRPKKSGEAAFVEALVESGQAARPDASGKRPAGATHELVEDKKGEVTAVRRRFSIS